MHLACTQVGSQSKQAFLLLLGCVCGEGGGGAQLILPQAEVLAAVHVVRVAHCHGV